MTEFEALLQTHFVPLQRYIRYKIANLHDAEDVMQEVCMTASEKFPTLKDRAAFKAWLIGIAGHKCMDYWHTAGWVFAGRSCIKSHCWPRVCAW